MMGHKQREFAKFAERQRRPVPHVVVPFIGGGQEVFYRPICEVTRILDDRETAMLIARAHFLTEYEFKKSGIT